MTINNLYLCMTGCRYNTPVVLFKANQEMEYLGDIFNATEPATTFAVLQETGMVNREIRNFKTIHGAYGKILLVSILLQ